MRKALFAAVVVLAATLFPTASNAEVHKCHGEVANIVGTPGDDTIYGTDGGNDVIAGLGGNDTIYGLNAEPDHSIQEPTIDTICGHGGSDTIYTGCVNAMCNGASALGGRGADEIMDMRGIASGLTEVRVTTLSSGRMTPRITLPSTRPPADQSPPT
jgi:Ca2+-binding RTX toxin-like protein